jgi:23S rRNA U2552 (ribose-2'-O)-methylase RlmE/FtsJ
MEQNYSLVLPKVKPYIGTHNNYKFLNKIEFDKLVELKNNINTITNSSSWDRAKKITNPYELVYTPNKKMRIDSIADRNPLSRSYFKLWEILHEFSKENNNQQTHDILYKLPRIKVAHIAEGPGGFMEAMINFRNQVNFKNDRLYGITLYPSNKEIPGWRKTHNLLKQNPNISIIYGKDKTGDIYNPENILDFKQKVGEADIVTADGGFDFSIDFNKQEELALKLIFCEIVCALAVQKKGGFFVCKMFDLYTHMSIKLLYLLKCLYESVNIYKPTTSRPANSEKYIIASGFKGIDPIYFDELLNVVKVWYKLDDKYTVLDVLADIPYPFYDAIRKYNTSSCNIQNIFIKKTLNIIKHKCSISYLKYLLQLQIKNAVTWCQTYRIPVNNKSHFIKHLPARPDYNEEEDSDLDEYMDENLQD